ncbi:homoprotocatechuate degradation operon regulator HpaR [Noviherbaspirillum cavernae]|uniref:Homoprotocatechuate degradation operon regulator HpaR n=1 Tax=Noviherbaspirillum cavernae TaxID=2320862 RepID=A0A418WV41_9BURK|nr:homoprotocatechuate degradation operon regulator HpaR [Noviherbaspirillum cavernae]RJF96575.1 homoprotocatechuate degradation operon regulator HpaR [Noviherbaspirillum cavernae]
MNQRISYRNLPQLFLKAREHLMSHFRPILNHFGLTEQQWRILRALDEDRQLEPREICDICQIISSNMAGVLARMEDMDLIVRSRSAEDQRRVLVRLSRKGELLVDDIAPLIEAQYHHIEEAYGVKLFGDVFKVLEKFVLADDASVEHVALPAAKSVSLERASVRGAGKVQKRQTAQKAFAGKRQQGDK